MEHYQSGWKDMKKDITASITPVQCISYVLSQIGVSTIVPGVKNVDELGTALDFLNATDEEKDLIQLHLDGQLAAVTVPAATATLAQLPTVDQLAPADPALEQELSDAIQGHLLEQLEEINDRLELALDQQAPAEAPGITLERILLYAGLVAFLVALSVSLVVILLMKLVLP